MELNSIPPVAAPGDRTPRTRALLSPGAPAPISSEKLAQTHHVVQNSQPAPGKGGRTVHRTRGGFFRIRCRSMRNGVNPPRDQLIMGAS